ncbi:MAG: hypothetical protein AB7S74_07290 [Hyphomicrobium sp.]
MQICVHLDAARLYRWHLALLTALADAGHEVAVSFRDTPEPLPTSFTALIDYDHARARAGMDRFSTLLRSEAFSSWPQYAGGTYDLMLDLSSASTVKTHPGRIIRPLYNGSFMDYALFHAILQQRAPILSVSDSISRDHVWLIGTPAVETPWRPSVSMDMISSRLVEGLVRVVNRIAHDEGPQDPLPTKRSFAGRSTILSSATSLMRARIARKMGRVAEVVAGNEARWFVAWRKISSEAVTSSVSQKLEINKFRTLEDGGTRYFADPFVFVDNDTTHVFVEELPKATGRGIISHFTLASDGSPSKVTPVLETEFHLSYPLVFSHEGTIYMLPESSASGGLDLYRARRFPYEWEKSARLIEGHLHDATIFRHEGRWWIAAGTISLQSSSWDALSLFYAEALIGPWHAHPHNPVLIDAAAARPAGHVWRDEAGRLVRPAQNCTDGYGSSLTLRAIVRLDPEGFSEETDGAIAFEPDSGILGPHTLNRAGGFEVIDLFARPSALGAGYRT